MVKLSAAVVICLCLTGCVTRREQVLAPDATGVVIHAETGRPVEGAHVRYASPVEVEGAQARYAGPRDAPTVLTRPDGQFSLGGRTRTRLILAFPIGGVYRDAKWVRVSAPGMADGYASAGFVNRGGPARAIYRVPVLLFPADAAETPLHALMRDCIRHPQQHHALRLATHVAAIDPDNPPTWMDEGAAEAVGEHLQRVLPQSDFRDCAQGAQAYALYSSHVSVLWSLERARH